MNAHLRNSVSYRSTVTEIPVLGPIDPGLDPRSRAAILQGLEPDIEQLGRPDGIDGTTVSYSIHQVSTHRKSTLGNAVASHLYVDLRTHGGSKKFNERVSEGRCVVNVAGSAEACGREEETERSGQPVLAPRRRKRKASRSFKAWSRSHRLAPNSRSSRQRT